MKDQRGFSLIESMIATIVLTVGLVGTAELLAVSLRMHQLARGSAEASRHAQAKLEELTKANFATAPSIQITESDSLNQNIANYYDTPAPGYTRRWKVSAVALDTDLRQVEIRVVPVSRDRRQSQEARLTGVLRSW
jgi:prepilin-type N-terminal cleavage/methylation domain-containing protein